MRRANLRLLGLVATALELILEWGRRGEARRAESGDGVLGEATASPSPLTRGFAGAL